MHASLMHTAAKYLNVLAAAWGLASGAAAAVSTNVTLVFERPITNGVQLQLIREKVTLLSDKDLAKLALESKRWLETNYINGKPYVSEHSTAPRPVPWFEDTFYVVCVEGSRTNVYRHRSLKRVVYTVPAPEGRVFDVLHEARTTVYLYEHYGWLDDPDLVVTIVAEDPAGGQGAVKREEFVLWQAPQPPHSRVHLTGARLLGSHQQGTLAVEIELYGGWEGFLMTKKHTLRFVDGKWVPADKPAPPKADRKP